VRDRASSSALLTVFAPAAARVCARTGLDHPFRVGRPRDSAPPSGRAKPRLAALPYRLARYRKSYRPKNWSENWFLQRARTLLLDDDAIVTTVYEAPGKRHPKSRSGGRYGGPLVASSTRVIRPKTDLPVAFVGLKVAETSG
jgi:hypothetical protein